MRERDLERKLVGAIRAVGGICVKLVSPGTDGMPDRMALLPEGKIAFVEVKAPGKRLRALQLARQKQLEALGFKAFVLDDPLRVDALVKEVMRDEVHSS